MTYTNYIAAFFEAIKFKNPKMFAVIQTFGVLLFVVLQYRPEWITQYVMLSANEIDAIQVALMAIGAYTSTSTTDGLSPDHKKIKAIEAKNAGELDPQKYKL